jgi:class 3 adenylate cyclase
VSEPGPKDPWSKARHDLRTPINQILGYSELLQEEAEEAAHSAYVPDLQKIQTAARRLLALIDEHLSPDRLPAPAPAPAAPPEATPPPPAAPAQVAGALGAATVGADAAPGAPPAAQTLAQRREARRRAQAGAGPQASLLVVDDNEMNRDMLSRRLKAKGYAVDVAEDGQQALDKLARGGFDLVLLDVMMPGLSGIDVLKRVRTTNAVAELPIIMATAKTQSEDIVEALKAGANDYVTKPLDFPVVLARVQGQLALKHAVEEVQRLAADLEVKNAFIRNTFGRYLSEEIVASLLESPKGLALGGERRVVTILMSDLRGFTAIAERLAPEQVVKLLNHYLGAMADVILSQQGTIDEFIGDAILAIFGAPTQHPDDAARAVACATAMQLEMEKVNAWNRAEGLPEVEMGIAIHTGEVVVGNIGSEKRAKYGVVGTTINLTSRIETYTVGGQILISDTTLRAAGPDVSVSGQMLVRAKGAKEPILAHDLRGIGGRWSLTLPPPPHDTVELAEPIALQFFTLDGKAVSEAAQPGRLTSLSLKSADVSAEATLPVATNLKIRVLDTDGAEIPGDLYAKVVERPEGGPSGFRLRFTSMPPEIETFFKKRLAR